MPSTLVNEIPLGKSCRNTSHPGSTVPARGPGPTFWGRWWQPSRGYPLPPVSSHWGVNSANTSPQKGIPCSPPWEYCARRGGGPSFSGGGGGNPPPPPPRGNAQGPGSLAEAKASMATNCVALCCPWLAVVFLGGCCCLVVVGNLWWKNKPIIRRLGWLVPARV